MVTVVWNVLPLDERHVIAITQKTREDRAHAAAGQKNGDYTHTANGTVVGQIIIQGDINKGGNSDAFLYGKSVPSPPGAGEPPTTLIALTAWQK